MPLPRLPLKSSLAIAIGLAFNLSNAGAMEPIPEQFNPADIVELEDEINRVIKDPQPLGEQNKGQIDDIIVDKSAQPKAENQLQQATFTLNGVRIKGNTTLEQPEVLAIVKPYISKQITGLDLQQIAAKITQLFVEKGYATSRCIIPKQTVKNGNVVLQIEEDKLGNIALSGKASYQYNPMFFGRYFYDLQGKIIDINKLNKRLQTIARLPSTRVKPRLQKSAFGVTDLILELEEQEDKTQVSFSNYASENTGKNRLSAASSFNNLTGNGDKLTTLLSVNPSDMALFNSLSGFYIRPTGNEAGFLKASASVLNYKLDPNKLDNVSITQLGAAAGIDLVVIDAINGGFGDGDDLRYEGTSAELSFGYEKPTNLFDFGNFSWGANFTYKQITSSTIINKQVVDRSVQIPIETFTDTDGTFEILETSIINTVFDAGHKWYDNEDTLATVDFEFKGTFTDALFDKPSLSYTKVKVLHALEGFMGSMTQEDIELKQQNSAALIPGRSILETNMGPIGNVNGMEASFWKLYFNFERLQPIYQQLQFISRFNAEYTNVKKIPKAFEYTGADNGAMGYDYDLSLSHPIMDDTKVALGYRSETAYSYFNNFEQRCSGKATQQKRQKCQSASPYISVSYRNDDFSVGLRYRHIVDAFLQNQQKFNISAAYRF